MVAFPACLVAWWAVALIMLMAGMELKLFALKPFQETWEALLLTEDADQSDEATTKRQTFALNAGVLFHLLAESTPELIITVIEEELTPEELRWNSLAIASATFSVLTLISEVWPIVYNICREGSVRRGLERPNLALSPAQVTEKRRGFTSRRASYNVSGSWSRNLHRVSQSPPEVVVGRPVMNAEGIAEQ